ncbi:hypothetical protein RHMOL_Rhmol13G0070100 [Rhododendron molle]|uniref:Uncharacterized protein n=1 Tax=Rhododendron molle TaxID=49168 RepID=A0ACC0L4H0_RHOML|nr:hypothetical protein RHMOL_Rhmol13G0070100 [Rhododendron molle]
MGKTPVKMKAVVYALSPFQQKVMPGLWKDIPGKIHHKVSENWISATLLLTPLVGVYILAEESLQVKSMASLSHTWKHKLVTVRPELSGKGEDGAQVLKGRHGGAKGFK